MHKEVIKSAFDKAKQEEQREGVKEPSNTSIAIRLSESIRKKTRFSFGERRLRDYYNAALKEDNDDINIGQQKVLIGLCKYLGYKDYKDFLVNNPYMKRMTQPKTRKEEIMIFIKRYRIVLLMCLITVMAVILINYFNKQRWMVWEGDHYVEVRFDAEKYSLSRLKLYNSNRIANFKQIIPDCNNTKFFNDNGSPNLWYGKSTKGELEYFTSLGKHPETGKTLKEITDYMIKKHICKK